MARGIKFYFTWPPSELNNADEGSRKFDDNYDGSKLLTYMLDGDTPMHDATSPAVSVQGDTEKGGSCVVV